jgi:hypothetical protein
MSGIPQTRYAKSGPYHTLPEQQRMYSLARA